MPIHTHGDHPLSWNQAKAKDKAEYKWDFSLSLYCV